jgi:transcriptional regulator with XRE-family HTH domain
MIETMVEAVKLLRKTLAITQQEFANRLGVSVASVSRWEAGQFAPDVGGRRKLYRLARETDGIEAADAALVFVRGDNSAGARPGMVNAEILAHVDQYFVSAAAKLTRAASDPTLTAELRAGLIGEALLVIREGRQLIAEIESNATEDNG